MSWSLPSWHARRAYIAVAGLPQILLAAALLAVAPARAAEPLAVQALPDVAYGLLPGEVGDLYSPFVQGLKPAVVLIHGGGWVGGSRFALRHFAQVMAAAGLVVFNIDYRLAVSGQPDTRWPAQLRDAQLAVRFLRAHAAEFGVDPSRIGAAGDSAGGQIAVFLGSLPKAVAGDVAGQYPGQRSDVQAVVDQFGPVDIAATLEGADSSLQAIFGTLQPTEAQYRSASPLLSLSSHSAPMLIVQGDEDTVVAPRQSRDLMAASSAKHVPTEFVSYAGGHEYAGLGPHTVWGLESQMADWLVQQLRR